MISRFARDVEKMRDLRLFVFRHPRWFVNDFDAYPFPATFNSSQYIDTPPSDRAMHQM
jgi:hypothetical protein